MTTAQSLRTVIAALEAATNELRTLLAGDGAPLSAGRDRPRVVIALFDHSCLGLVPWWKRGYDLRHPAT